MSLVNPGFETGDTTGWTITSYGGKPQANVLMDTGAGYVDSGTYSVRISSTGSTNTAAVLLNEWTPLIRPGSQVSVQARVRSRGGIKGDAYAWVGIRFILSNGGATDVWSRMLATGHMRNGFTTLGLAQGAPEGAIAARMMLIADVQHGERDVYFDSCTMSVTGINDDDVRLTYPAAGSVYTEGDTIPYRVAILEGLPVTAVKYVVTNTTTADTEEFNASAAPWNVDDASLEDGSYSVLARVTIGTGSSSVVVTTNSHGFLVGTPPEPETREFKASNAYTLLVARNFSGITAGVPPTARVLGAEILLDYNVNALVRSINKDSTDPEVADYAAVFNIAPSLVFEATLLEQDGSGYTASGTPLSNTAELSISEFSVVEDGSSEGKRWTVLEGTPGNITLGGDNDLFGIEPIPAHEFAEKAVGIRVYPNLGSVPSHLGSGDAAYRVLLDKLRLRVYFDAGSVDYYFASPDKDHVIKGRLVASYTTGGDLRTGDASGVLQLTPALEQMDGSQTWIGNDWTIHSGYPVTDANQIGEVADLDDEDELGMEYNGLPTQEQVRNNRSRYQFITENFYGDPVLNSIYGVHGLARAFAYNGDYFYKIYTQADPEKDNPRHVANHHLHLALGFHGGRVDISVAGEPYNYNGVDGASSWAFGDKVVGLLPLSGTILGVFGSKGVYGISGTTVDNFATQVISPNIGAIEYTICDMGFPVYANAYGVYTLSQTQQYGDYLGQPMSQDISPWLRPRLLRKNTSDKEVVCAFPVRSKNQYRLCFRDGYITTMTLNGQQVPTFSLQKYFYKTVSGDCLVMEEDTENPGAWRFTPDVPGLTIGSQFVVTPDTYNEFDHPTELARFAYYGPQEGGYEYEYSVIHSSGWQPTGRVHIFDAIGEGGLGGYLGCAVIGEPEEVDVYDRPSIVPAAISSELDDAGEERIHIAGYVGELAHAQDPVYRAAAYVWTYRGSSEVIDIALDMIDPLPEWLNQVNTPYAVRIKGISPEVTDTGIYFSINLNDDDTRTLYIDVPAPDFSSIQVLGSEEGQVLEIEAVPVLLASLEYGWYEEPHTIDLMDSQFPDWVDYNQPAVVSGPGWSATLDLTDEEQQRYQVYTMVTRTGTPPVRDYEDPAPLRDGTFSQGDNSCRLFYYGTRPND